MGFRYSEQMKLRAVELRSEGLTWQDVADTVSKEYKVELDKENFRKLIGKYQKSSSFRKDKIVYDNKKDEPTIEDVGEYWSAIIGLQKADSKLHTRQTKISLSIEDDRPIGIAYSGDWHLGGFGTDHEKFLEDREIIVKTDGLYLIGMGDYKDNNLQAGHKGAIYQQVVPPGAQDLLVIDTAKYLKPKALVFVRGNHDDWSTAVDGKDFMQEVCLEAEAVNLWHGGVVYLTIGDFTYKIGVRHKFKYESGLNTTNSQRRMNEQLAGCDIVAVGDKHYVDMQRKVHMGRKTTWLRSGTYKIVDEFGQKIGGYEGEWGVPITVLFPDKKRVIAFDDFYDGVEYLNSVRKQYNEIREEC